jgi:thiosulfate reductase cytochrome b subunit
MLSHQNIYAPGLAMPTRNVLHRTKHSERHAKLSHQMPQATAEASARLLIRAVPLAYGFLLGGLSDHLLPGLLAGLAVAVVLDLRLHERSVTWACLQLVAGHFRRAIGPKSKRFLTRFSPTVIPVPGLNRSTSSEQTVAEGPTLPR